MDTLCNTCTRFKVAIGDSPNEQITRCQLFGREIPFPVQKCSEYADRRQPDLGDLYDMAFYIVSDKRTGKIGFVSADEYRKEHGPKFLTLKEGISHGTSNR